MANFNIFTNGATASKKQIVTEKAATNRETRAALADFVASIEAEFTKVVKDKNPRVRNLANAVKGRYHTALNVVAACYPYQTAAPVVTETRDENGRRVVSVAGGELLTKVTTRDTDGAPVGRVWSEKKLTRAAAAGIVRDALKNYTNTLGAPVVVVGVVGEAVAE